MLYAAYFLLYAIAFLFGSSIFSFINVVVYRVPLGVSVARGRSFCPQCRTTLKPYDMVPVLSYFVLHGKCRSCGGKISLRYPLVEAFGGAVAVLCFLRFGVLSVQMLLCFCTAALLTAVALIDYDTMTIPNGLTLALLLPACASVFVFAQVPFFARCIGAVAVSLPMLLINCLVAQSFGGGDIKLMAVCGFMLGWQGALLAGFVALLLGGTHGIILLLRSRKNRKAHFAFGPYLCIGIFISMLYGEFIIAKYLNLFGL
ncbi:MAG: prepilin peptidase [Hydrogenoanaerobacterium sp.]